MSYITKNVTMKKQQQTRIEMTASYPAEMPAAVTYFH